jgi:hypothetical protein
MKTKLSFRLFLCAAAVMLFAGCATSRIDWNARLGHYTYDQAVMEFGPPDSQARLSDGRLVAEWISHYSSGGTMMVGGGISSYPGFFCSPTYYSGPTYYESKLLLTFGTNNVLVAWSRK